MNEFPFTREDLINFLSGSKNAKDAIILKVIHALDDKLDEQTVKWRELYDQVGEAKFITALANEFARAHPDSIRGICLSLILRQVKAVNIDDKGTDSSGTGDATGSDSHEQ